MNEKPDAMPKSYGELTFGAGPKALQISTLDEAWRFGKMIVHENMAPPGLDTVGKIAIAVLRGAEVGMSPFMSLERIAVINGRATIWGDAALSIVMTSGLLEEIEEHIDGQDDARTAYCTVKRRGFKARTSSFSVADSKTARLWGTKVWAAYPDRMLAMRARGFALRDNFADALGGMYLREEFSGISEKTIDGELAPPFMPEPPTPPTSPTTPEPPEPPEPPELPESPIDLAAMTIEYEQSVDDAKSEDELDELWSRLIQPAIEAGVINETRLQLLGSLDDARRGVLHQAG